MNASSLKIGATYRVAYRPLPPARAERTLTAKLVGIGPTLLTFSGREQRPDFGTVELSIARIVSCEEVERER